VCCAVLCYANSDMLENLVAIELPLPKAGWIKVADQSVGRETKPPVASCRAHVPSHAPRGGFPAAGHFSANGAGNIFAVSVLLATFSFDNGMELWNAVPACDYGFASYSS
jgi:hypothetical protein